MFSKVFQQDQDEMIKHLNQGDVANTIKTYFEKSKRLKPLASSKLTLKQVDKLLLKLTQLRADNDQMGVLKEIAERCTPSDLLMIMRLIKKDLRINAGEKVILDGVAENAYNAFKVSRDLDDVIERLLKSPLKKDLSIKINLMKPVKPMLADACKSAEAAIKKCDNGAYVEIKYDGERLQVHKSGNKFEYYSRNLKQVQPVSYYHRYLSGEMKSSFFDPVNSRHIFVVSLKHKVEHLKQFIPKAFPFAHDLILDGEVLLYDTKTKKPLPFGTLGVHKVRR
jgi:DNA ligase-3